ncbi:hypothetical protein KUTeg_022668 [Tegillarca granosa]|uniref:Transglutaminase-like domain-containing protein n=1 Tax=Tegillarca granosa TaxID=220873 RepID=A0ABQ9DZF7_TEGGR|nr:hypothetical protein KUTeg_022668 [Tegillarca granosa]
MGDPIRVSRAISSIVNSQDDKGILVGNWTNNYTAGVSPLKWSGSVAILREYMETNLPVKFGQCFVFSGIVTTICRAIGIPCRSVTNFSSAHDTDGSTTIDVYWDLEKGEKISHGESKDSIWNFHVWNDVWMKRRDLPPQFSGWQAIDSTPQERSNGKLQCGPASLHGIKEGLTEEQFDSPFIFAEVNGDKINWARQIDGRRYVLSIDSSIVGKRISTKIPDGKPDITFDGFEKLDYIMVGSDFELGGMIRNTGNEMRTVEVKFICEAVSYKGHRLNTIKQQSFNGVLQPRNGDDIPPNDRWSAVLTLTPTKPGKRQIFVTFNSDIIQDISGVAEYTTYSRDFGGSDDMGRLNYSTTNGDYGRADYSTYDRGYGRSNALDDYLRSVYGVTYRQPIWTERYEDTDYYSRDYGYGSYGNRGSYTYGDGRNRSYGSPRYASDRYGRYDNGYGDPYDYGYSYGNDTRYRSHRHDRNDNRDRGYREERQLNVKSIDLMVAENSFDHHTYKYDAVRNDNLVIRRGQSFDISLRFNRDFNEETDSLRFIFKTVLALDSKTEKGVMEQCMLGSKYSASDFKAVLRKRKARDEIVVSVYVSANCIVSTWKMCIETVFLSDNEATSVAKTKDMYFIVLFNPWCEDDDVYLPNDQLLKEYIENDSGVIFQGTNKQIGGKPWFFGQVNSQDDNGILAGNWSGDYTGGVSPLKWSGSVAILLEHSETNRPVRFGQCFVFSGIVTTICRALGIPCRSVTNFKSAHDTDGNTTIDSYFDIDTGRYLDSKDSIWNFHVWNDVWIRRNDLPNGFSGWQVIDATPQERSDGKMQCGPVSLRSIKEGFTNHLFDAPFVFAEVNGDRVTWGKSKHRNDLEMMGVESSLVGKKICTKYPDGKSVPPNLTDVENIRYDITDQYKYKDASRVSMPITYRDYGDKVNEQAVFKLSISLRHRYTGQTQSYQDDFRLRRPDLKVDILERRCTKNRIKKISRNYSTDFN